MTHPRCEDAPCCGCCGPGSDDPAYHERDPYDEADLDRAVVEAGQREFWVCDICNAQNHVMDGECQFCEDTEIPEHLLDDDGD